MDGGFLVSLIAGSLHEELQCTVMACKSYRQMNCGEDVYCRIFRGLVRALGFQNLYTCFWGLLI